MEIKDIHKTNFEKIKKLGIKIGQKWQHKDTKDICEITHIHTNYGWVVVDYDFMTSSRIIKNDLSNINEWKLIKE